MKRKNQIDKVTRTIDVIAEPPPFKDPLLTCQPKAITEFESTKQDVRQWLPLQCSETTMMHTVQTHDDHSEIGSSLALHRQSISRN